VFPTSRIEGKKNASHARRDSLYLLLLGAAIFLAIGLILSQAGKTAMHDFRTAYYSGLALLDHGDPYDVNEIEKLYSKESPRPAIPDPDRIVVTANIYLPSAFPFTVVLALLPEGVALALWNLVIVGAFLLSAFAIWRVCADRNPMAIALLLAFCLVNSGSLIYLSNPAGFVAPLCVLAALSFIYDKFVPAGIACLAISLAFKPHDGGLIWLYFLLAGGAYRKRALQTLLVIVAFSLPALLWVMSISPHWLQELSTNMAAFSGPHDMNDPRGSHGFSMMTNLQTVTSFFWSDAKTYNLATYLVCAPLLLWWAYLALRARPSKEATWFALASISVLSLLPIYHRQYDAKLIFLALPALVVLWTRRGGAAWIAAALTAIAFLLNADLPWVVFLRLMDRWGLYGAGFAQPIGVVLANFPVPLSLLAIGVFYLWAYSREILAQHKPSLNPSVEEIPS
jgi:hypothetical protein